MHKTKTISVFIVTALLASVFGFSANAQTAPSLSGESATVTGSHSAQLSVFVNPNGSTTELHFKYWTGSVLKERLYLGVRGTSSVRIEVGLINLLESSSYSWQVVAINSSGTTTGVIGTFNTSVAGTSTNTNNNSNSTNNSSNNNSSNTSQGAPLVETNGPVSVSANSATINGSINPNSSSTNFWFEFGTTSSLGQKTNIQPAGSGNSWQLVTGNLSNLETQKTYYYRVAAQNSQGTNFGEVRNFTTTNSNGNSSNGSNNQPGGQVLGSASGNGTGTTDGTKNSSGSGATSKSNTSTLVNDADTVQEGRPSFISLEYSLNDSDALVLVADDVKPRPGDEFSYTVVYKNDTGAAFNEAKLKVIIPNEVEYVYSSLEPNQIYGNIVEFNLNSIPPKGQGTVVVVTRIRENVKSGVNIIYTSVLEYKDKNGVQLATTSYLTVKAGQIDNTAASVASMFSSGSLLWLIALALFIVMVLLVFRYRSRNGYESESGGFNYNPLDEGELKSEKKDFLPNLPLVTQTYPPTYESLKSEPVLRKKVVLGFAFGNRGSDPGLSNESMARVIKAQYPDALTSVQWEIGTALKRIGQDPNHEVKEHLLKKNSYLDTEEVARQMADFLRSQNGQLDIYAIAQDDHMPRVLKVLSKFGIKAKRGCVNIPYDPLSSQIWTRSNFLFKLRELLAWPLYVAKGHA